MKKAPKAKVRIIYKQSILDMFMKTLPNRLKVSTALATVGSVRIK